jgi:hypothetical protein
MFQRLKDHQCGFSSSMGLPLQRLIAESHSNSWLINLPYFPLETGSVICGGNRLPAIG